MPIHHLAIRVADVGRSLQFYRDLLGLSVLREPEPGSAEGSAWLQCGPSVLMLEPTLRGAGPMAGSAHVLVFPAHELGGELTHWLALLAQSGIRVDDRTVHTLYFRDPDGHRVGVSDFSFR